MDVLAQVIALAVKTLEDEGHDMVGAYAIIEVGTARGIWCGRCQRVSFNPRDVDEKYCGVCHVFLDTEVRAP